jgi:hypothetical protein
MWTDFVIGFYMMRFIWYEKDSISQRKSYVKSAIRSYHKNSF